MTLILYQGKWYRTHDELMTTRAASHFDLVIEVIGSDFIIVKNRYTGTLGRSKLFTDLIRMKLWVDGKSLYDLPEFHTCSEISVHEETVIGYKDNGDLFEYSLPIGIK